MRYIPLMLGFRPSAECREQRERERRGDREERELHLATGLNDFGTFSSCNRLQDLRTFLHEKLNPVPFSSLGR